MKDILTGILLIPVSLLLIPLANSHLANQIFGYLLFLVEFIFAGILRAALPNFFES